MSIKRLLDVVERRGDIGRWVVALVLPISNRPRMTSNCTGKVGLREPGEHTTGPNLVSRDNVAHARLYKTILRRRHWPHRFVQAGPNISHNRLNFRYSRIVRAAPLRLERPRVRRKMHCPGLTFL